jgi:dTDP-4-dehydrorhamnose reductase
MAPSVLVFGSTGQVARELARADWAAGTELVFLDRAAADLAKPERLGAVVASHAPDAIVVAAAYTAVDKAESEEDLAVAVNARGPATIAAAAAELDCPVVHLSTDYVFDGAKPSPYEEEDATGPLNAYGRSKLAGEEAVRAANPRHFILRTSWVYSAHGANFVRTMLRLAATRDEVRVVADQQGCPTAAHDLACAIARVVPMAVAGTVPPGIYHLAGATATTWHGFAEAIFAELERRGLRRPANAAISTREYPTPARRPLSSRLSGSRAEATLGLSLAGFERALPRVLDEILAQS